MVWWITAESVERIEAGLAGLTAAVAARVGKVAPPVAAGWAVGFLTAHPGWLLVLDNVEDRADVEALLAILSGGRVLITSAAMSTGSSSSIPVFAWPCSRLMRRPNC